MPGGGGGLSSVTSEFISLTVVYASCTCHHGNTMAAAVTLCAQCQCIACNMYAYVAVGYCGQVTCVAAHFTWKVRVFVRQWCEYMCMVPV